MHRKEENTSSSQTGRGDNEQRRIPPLAGRLKNASLLALVVKLTLLFALTILKGKTGPGRKAYFSH
jgi:hypothetical protein